LLIEYRQRAPRRHFVSVKGTVSWPLLGKTFLALHFMLKMLMERADSHILFRRQAHGAMR
jgi:hypothetical protein